MHLKREIRSGVRFLLEIFWCIFDALWGLDSIWKRYLFASLFLFRGSQFWAFGLGFDNMTFLIPFIIMVIVSISPL
jgi:hypothetical protein